MIDKLLFKVALLILFSVFLQLNIYSQTEIHGTLIDSTGFLIPGAQIIERGTQNGVASDPAGNFKFRVADTSKIQISMIGYYDTIMSPQELQGDTILMRIYPYIDGPVYIPTYHRSFSIGLTGDVTYMPFGVMFSYFKPHLFRKKILSSVGFAIKSDFRSDYDAGIHLIRHEIIHTNKYNLTCLLKYRKRNINLSSNILRSQDFEFITRNSLFGKISVSPGILYRNETFEIPENGFGFYFGADRNFDKIDQFWNINMRTFKDSYEYGISITQGFSNRIYPLSRFRIGLSYNKYRHYNEFNIGIIYKIN